MSLRWKVAQAAEIKWWEGYLKNKPKADYLAWKYDYWKTLVQKTAIVLQKGDLILDAGCGPAGVFMVLEDQQVDAVDPLLDSYEKKLTHFEKKAYPHAQFFAQSLEDFELTKEYDHIFCLNAIHQLVMAESLRQAQTGLVFCLSFASL